MAAARLRREEWPHAVFALVVVAALVTATATSAASFSPYNGEWNGGSDLGALAAGAGATTDVTLDTAAYGSVPAAGTVAVVVSPARAYGPADAARVERFVRAGGTLLVAEDFGPHSNALLADVGARSRLDGRLVVDDRAFYNAPTMPVARPDASVGLLVDVDAFTLNHGTVVEPNGAQALVESSAFATLVDDDGAPVAASLGPYPFVTGERIGAGSVVVVSDASALINVMLDRPGNAAFAANLFARHDRVLVDQSHGADAPPIGRALEALQTTPLLQIAAGVAVAVVVGLLTAARSSRRRGRSVRRVARRLGVGRRPPPAAPADGPASDLAAGIHERRPDWDDARVERVARAIDELAGETGRDAESPDR
jgi:hypothetical protein